MNLTSPILMTMPTYTALDTSNPNNTLACGYFDPLSTIFSQTGFSTTVITNWLVTCKLSHLSQIAVEQYEQTFSAAQIAASRTVTNVTEQEGLRENEVVVINMWASWAVYADLGLIGALLVGLFFMRRLDNRDEQYLDIIRRNKKRIYVNLFLEPIEEVQLPPPPPKVEPPKPLVTEPAPKPVVVEPPNPLPLNR